MTYEAREPKRVATHPGRILRHDILEETGLTQMKAAQMLGVSFRSINEIVGEKRSISPEMALRIERVFGVSARFWMELQTAHDLSKAKQKKEKEIETLTRFRNAV